jgi:hypothetical protein
VDLNRQNYHSLDAERLYMSVSQYNSFLECEARQMAMLAGAWVEERPDAFLVGEYVHCWAEGNGAKERFIEEHPEMFTKQGKPKAAFEVADKMIAALEADPLCMYMLEGEKEVIFTARFAGCLWKIRADVHRPDRRRMVDLKTTRSIREHAWNDYYRAKANFVENYKYLLTAAIYCEIERLASERPEYDWLEYYLVAVSKESVPDKEVISLIDPDRYVFELDQVRQNMPHILDVKNRKIEPTRCERCNYCRSTKVLTGAVHYSEL